MWRKINLHRAPQLARMYSGPPMKDPAKRAKLSSSQGSLPPNYRDSRNAETESLMGTYFLGAGVCIFAYAVYGVFFDRSDDTVVDEVSQLREVVKSEILEKKDKMIDGVKSYEIQALIDSSGPLISEEEEVLDEMNAKAANSSHLNLMNSSRVKAGEIATEEPTKVEVERKETKVMEPLVESERKETKVIETSVEATNPTLIKQEDLVAAATKEENVFEGMPASSKLKKVAEDELKLKLEYLRKEASNRLNGEVTTLLQKQLEDTYTKGINSMSEEDLKKRILLLLEEHKLRASLEAFRLHQSLSRQEEIEHEKTLELLSEQAKVYDEQWEVSLQEQRESLQNSFDAHTQSVIQREFSQSGRQMQKNDMEMKNELELLIERADNTLASEWREKLTSLHEKYHKKIIDEVYERSASAEEAYASILALDNKLKYLTDYNERSNQVHEIESTLYALETKIKTEMSFISEWNTVKVAARGDTLISTVLESLPEHYVNGSPTILQLQQDYKKVSKATRIGSKIPENSGIPGKVLGNVTSALLITPGSGEGDSVEDTLINGEKALADGDLVKTVSILSALENEKFGSDLKSFLEIVRQRLAVQQAVSVVKARTTLLAKSFV